MKSMNGLGKTMVGVAICVALQAVCAWAAPRSMDDALVPHIGEWQKQDGAWVTGADKPPAGWYLRSQRQYDLKTLSFELRKDNQAGIVYLYTGDWRILFRADAVIAKYAGTEAGWGQKGRRYWSNWQYTATRPMRFDADAWQPFGITLDGDNLTISRGNEQILTFGSPREEWLQRVKDSGKISQIDEYDFPEKLPPRALSGVDQVVIFHWYNTGGAVRNVLVDGADKGEARDFVSDDPSEIKNPVVAHDWEIERLAPVAPVQVTWSLPEAEQQQARPLPAVAAWEYTGNGLVEPAENSPKVQDILHDGGDGRFPSQLSAHFRVKKTQAARLYFNLASAGDYTLQTEWGPAGLGWGPNVLQISVDGKPVSREVYRAFARSGLCSGGFDYVPLHLPAGPHRIDFELDLSHFHKVHRLQMLLRLPFTAVRLVPGVHEPEVQRMAGRSSGPPTSAEGLAAPIALGEVYGKLLRYRIGGLSAGKTYAVNLGFNELEVNLPGKRLMDVYLNGQQVEQELDVCARGGWKRDLFVKHEVQADADGAIEVRLVGRTFKAFLNHLKVEDADGKQVYAENCGWSKQVQARAERLREVEVLPRMASNTIPASPEPWTPESVFDGHNLVANPHFSLADNQRPGKPTYWYSGKDFAQETQTPLLLHYNLLQGAGEYALDTEVGREHAGALKVTTTAKDFGIHCNLPLVDPNKTQAFHFYAKTEGVTGRVFPEVIWCATNMDASSQLLKAPKMQYISRSSGQSISGDNDWTLLSVRAKPPLGAMYAVLVVRVEENTSGTVWVDDAEFNGYGDEPLEITYSHLGYHPRSSKRIVIKSKTEAPVEWALLDAATGQPVRSGMAAHKEYEWFSKRHYFTADFTDLQGEGEYRLQAVQGDVKVESSAFGISRDAYRELTRIMLNGLWIKRMNYDIPGAQEPGFLEDAYTPNSYRDDRFSVYEKLIFPGRRDLLGGYYDAGDMIKHTEYWPTAMLALRNMDQRVQPPLANRTENDIRDEMLWAYRSFEKFQIDDASFIISSKPEGFETDNVPFYSVDRTVDQAHRLRQAAGMCALVAWEMRESDPALSRRYQEMALLSYDQPGLWRELERPEALDSVGPKEVSLAAKCLWAEAYLLKLTGDDLYRKRMSRHAQILAKGLKNRAYRHLIEMHQSNDTQANILQDCAWVPAHVLRLHPDLPERGKLEEGMRAFAEHIRELSADTVWGQALAMNHPDNQPPMRHPGGINERPGDYWPMLAHALCEIGMYLQDREIILLAERQLQWCLGNNYADLCMVSGVGNRFIAGGDFLFWQSEFFNTWLNSDKKLYYYEGNVPKPVFREVGDGTVIVRKGNDYRPPLRGYPVGFCPMPVAPDYPMHPGVCENWLPLTSHYALAATNVYAALEWLDQQR